MKTLPLLAGLLVAAATASAHTPAQTAPKPRPLVGNMGSNVMHFVALYDDSGDGRLDWAEFDAFRRHRFDATDTDHDGTVDIEEYVAEFDIRRNKDLQQQRAGQVTMTQTRFAALDGDKDGQIARAEFDASGERVFAQGQKTLAALDDGSDTALRPRSRASLMPTSHTAEGFLGLYDVDGDGEVARAEFDARRGAQFTRTDSNGDGALDVAEYLTEFQTRLEARIAELANAPDTQSRVRFRSLDADKDTRMTFAEYQVSGKRMFVTADRNHSGIVDADDAKLPPPPHAPRDGRNNAAGVEHAGLPVDKKS